MTAIPQPTRADESASHSRWIARTGLSRVVRLAIWLVPVILSVVVIGFAAHRWPADEIGLSVVGWWAVFGALAMAVLVLTDRIARRFLPLSFLLRMALVFPDQAPSRFGSALRYGTPRKLLSRNPPTSMGLMSLVQAISHHDRATRGHSERVRAYSQLIGQELKLDQTDMDRLSWSALLHDVGKLEVSAEILNKKGDPDEAEWDELRQHPAKAPPYLVGFEHWLGDWGRAASEHHERWDGKGYPAGLRGDEIHQAGRIVSVADAYDVMTSVRSYKKSMPTAVAREEIARNAGEQFDPKTVRAFLNVGIGQVNTKWGAFAWVTQIPDVVSRAPAAGLVLAVALGASMGLIDPGRPVAAQPVAIVQDAVEAEPQAGPTDPVVAAEPSSTPTATTTATATPEALASAGGSGAGGSGAGGAGGDGGDDGDGDDDDDGGDDDDNDGDAADSPEDDPADQAESADSNADAPGPTATAPVATAPNRTVPNPTATSRPAGATAPAAANTPTPTPTVDPVLALFGPTVAPIPQDGVRPPVSRQPAATATPRPTSTTRPISTSTPTQAPTPTPAATATPRATATPAPTTTPIATSTPAPTSTPIATPTPTPPPTATPVPTPTSTPIPTATPTPTPIPTVTPTPTATPTPVFAFDDNFTIPPVVESYLRVLDNDDDQPGAPLDFSSLIITIPPLHADLATFAPHIDHVDYRPVLGYSGPDSFEYQICNTDGVCNRAVATIEVLGAP